MTIAMEELQSAISYLSHSTPIHYLPYGPTFMPSTDYIGYTEAHHTFPLTPGENNSTFPSSKVKTTTDRDINQLFSISLLQMERDRAATAMSYPPQYLPYQTAAGPPPGQQQYYYAGQTKADNRRQYQNNHDSREAIQ